MTMLHQWPDSGAASEGPSLLFEDVQQCTDQDVPLNLNGAGICPVCGNIYQPGENVVALTSLVVLTTAAGVAPGGHEQCSTTILGHHDCVVPRLVSLLVRVHRESRGAADEDAVGDCVFPEGHYETA